MRSKHVFQVFVLLAVLLAAVGSGQTAQAKANTDTAVVVVRQLSYWDATFVGYVDTTRYEKWPFTLSDTTSFVVTATPTTDGLTPLIRLLDSSDNEIANADGTLSSTQPAGSYSVQIQPETTGGNYQLSLQQTQQQDQATATTVIDPTSVTVGDSALVSLNLGNVPTEGYKSVEFTCTYDPAAVEVSDITAADLFGADPATAINGPQDGTFIVAIAGSDGNKDTTNGTAFTFNAKGLQAGQTDIGCTTRVSAGDNVLTDVQSTPATLTINDVAAEGTFSGQVTASKEVTVSLYNADASLATSATANPDGTFSLTVAAGTYTAVATASGFLNAQGSVTITAGETATLPTVSLLAGDIDGNGVIDQYDAMTIGMSYNTADPAAADLNNDGTINVLDLELLANNYRQSGSLAWQ